MGKSQHHTTQRVVAVGTVLLLLAASTSEAAASQTCSLGIKEGQTIEVAHTIAAPDVERNTGVHEWYITARRDGTDDYSVSIEGFDAAGQARVVYDVEIQDGFANRYEVDLVNAAGITESGVLEIQSGKIVTNTIPREAGSIFPFAMEAVGGDTVEDGLGCAVAISGAIAGGVGCAGCSLAFGICLAGCVAGGFAAGAAIGSNCG